MRGLLAHRTSPERALESLYRRHAGDVYRYALAVLGSPGDAEDVTQTTFINAYRAMERGEQPRQPRDWLRAIAHNLCRQHFRQAARRPHAAPLDEDVGELVADDEAPALDDLMRALKQLPYSQRSALVLREFEGRSLKEISTDLEVSPSAVETLLFRARRSLREQLEGNLTCFEAERAISQQLDGVLARAERGGLRAHLRSCDQCASLARRLRAQRGAMRSLGLVPLPVSLASVPIGGGAAASGVAGGAVLAGPLVAKVAAGALAAAAVAGLGYESAAHHVWRIGEAKPAHVRGRSHSPARPHRPRVTVTTPAAFAASSSPPRNGAQPGPGHPSPSSGRSTVLRGVSGAQALQPLKKGQPSPKNPSQKLGAAPVAKQHLTAKAVGHVKHHGTRSAVPAKPRKHLSPTRKRHRPAANPPRSKRAHRILNASAPPRIVVTPR
jgi:RNA polymerase sigma factor (sigma-70 family)